MRTAKPDNDPLWRGSLLPLGCAAVVKSAPALFQEECIGTASRSSGSKLPRHKSGRHISGQPTIPRTMKYSTDGPSKHPSPV
ncbi:hypothetical protein C1X89_14625 [Pseudomonas sp. GP01-A8]|nr:hypothetical protein C0058_30430 [Pseudomonas sp. NC02]PMU28299.1 hypothetical protein C1X90_01945 [Pseudomonas sp. GP01-A9]PMU28638.1 hypothetical protein C1X88_17440 [Pseudomonas sp. GP01-A13]PMU39191.1 hypothetical protein C1X89_14625 [Pseudomonas sp. GP01-A8]PMU53452.1 hypothetical protein C1X87_08670 [Pseudomonas sp. GP01-A14]PMU56778.1 hypothetical protein C1X85_06690 [Pseudomonas sp. GP01-A6]PMU64118.1 hypothetical protein C1X86_04585 [Pseudomonas sp. GP01-A3]PMU79911.1 hypothetica